MADFPQLARKAHKLSRWYIYTVMYHERDEDGRIVQPQAKGGSAADTCRRILRARGVPEYQMERKVAEMLKASKRRR